MSSAEEIIGKLIDKHTISGEEAIILLKSIYGRENSDHVNLSGVVGQPKKSILTWSDGEIFYK